MAQTTTVVGRAPRALIVALALTASALGAAGAQQSPVGLWKTIDDSTKKERSLVRIAEAGGSLSGRIEKGLDPQADPNAVCSKCTDDRKDRPLIGLVLIRGVKPSEGSPGVWEGGDIVDPDNGKVYRVRLTPIEDGRKLEVRGYIGMPLLGRTQTWIRVE